MSEIKTEAYDSFLGAGYTWVFILFIHQDAYIFLYAGYKLQKKLEKWSPQESTI